MSARSARGPPIGPLLGLCSDAWELVGERLGARDIAALGATCTQLRAESAALVRGRVRRHRRATFGAVHALCCAAPEARSWGEMGVVDLARAEAWIAAPSGDCTCCLRRAPPLKLGTRCVDCVAREASQFVPGARRLRHAEICLAMCQESHRPRALFTCPVCEVGMCLQCMCDDRGCSMCRLDPVDPDEEEMEDEALSV